jgi:hypothetical protein
VSDAAPAPVTATTSSGSLIPDATGWKPDDGEIATWTNDRGEVMTLSESPGDPALDLTAMRVELRRYATDGGGGLVSAAWAETSVGRVVEAIIKLPNPDGGMVYVGSLFVDVPGGISTLTFVATEAQPTGVRDAVVLDGALNDPSSGVTFTDDGELIGWMADPYDPTHTGGIRRNRAEAPEHDVDFPDHPLTRVRVLLASARAALRRR